MSHNSKQEKKVFVSQFIDLSNGRYKDREIDILYDLVLNRNTYDGTSKTKNRCYDDWSSDGKYTRNEETTYTFRVDVSGIYIEMDYQYKDDDGQTGSEHRTYRTGREILRNLDKVFD